MIKFLSNLALFASASCFCLGQMGGNSVYNQRQPGSAQASELAKRTISKDDMPLTANSMFLDASILMNVKADEFVAIFGISQEGVTLEECNAKMTDSITQFTSALKKLGVTAGALDVDFVAQNRIYGFELRDDVAREKLTGFELKKNVAIHFHGKGFLDKCIAAASRTKIFDLIKVDYVVKDVDTIHNRLMAEAARVLKQKATNHAKLLGIKLRQPAQVYAEKYSCYLPTEMYDSYTAFESEDVSSAYYRQKYTVQGARKSRTFYYNALDARNFDAVVNPVVVEPVVQYTLYLKVNYRTGPEAKKDTVKARK